jgi:tetratricopeptide (TPR) repeat protein
MEAYVLAQLGNFDRAQAALQHGRQVSDGLGSPLVNSDVDLFAALTFLSMGQGEQALELAQRSVETAIATDNMDCICTGLACLGYTNLEVGRLPQALEAFQQGIERSELTGALLSKLSAQAGLAVTQFMTGHAEAIKELEEAIANMSLHQNHVGAASANLMLGACLIQIGELDRASSALNQAVDFYRQARMHPFLARSLASLADLRDRQGQLAEALTLRAEAESVRSSSVDNG